MDDGTIAPARHRLDADAYHRMGEAGILGADERTELIGGDIIDMAPIGQGHAGTVDGLLEALFVACAGRAIVSAQNPVRLDQHNEPQPDLAVLRRRADFYATGDRPGPADVLLIVEVADSSLRFDRTVKLPMYARAGIPEVWIVDLRARAVEVHREPGGDAYRRMATHGAGEDLALAVAPEIVVRLGLPG